MEQELSFSSFHYFFSEHGFYAEPVNEPETEGNTLIEPPDEKERYRMLYQSAFKQKPKGVDATGQFLLQLASGFIEDLTREPDLELLRENITLDLTDEKKGNFLSQIPFALGSEFVDGEWLENIYKNLCSVFSEDIKGYDGTVAFYLAEKSQTLSVPERIFFHLVENEKDEVYPFAFLATYGTKTDEGKIKHVPLQYALTEYAHSNEQLLKLLSCLDKVAEVSEIIDGFVKRGELFHPLRLTSEEAFQILTDLPKIEKAGIICRVPNWWKRNAASVSVSVNLGEEKPAYVGLETILGMKPSLSVDGVSLTEDEVRDLLEQSEGLALLKGKWVVVNHERLRRLLEKLGSYEGEMTLLEALRGGMMITGSDETVDADIGPLITNGSWLSNFLSDIRNPSHLKKTKPPATFKAKLRPYQSEGYEWLRTMDSLKFGACLADDMGLGKTVQVLAFLENMRKKNKQAKVLLIVPASLIGNWKKEAEKFAPAMSVSIFHGRGAKQMDEEMKREENISFLSITTYGMTARMEGLKERTWDCLILDEAQAIKNPVSKQTRQIKQIQAKMRIAMTGTPIENDLTNLWSLFDFLDKGLLGTSAEFRDYTKRLVKHPEGYAKLKNMIAPFMLRRVKTDKKIISDLPDKVENIDYVTLSKKQKVLYRKYIHDLEIRIEDADGIERRGIVLGALSKLKQICNHPDQYLGQETYEMKESGKFELLKELCMRISEKRERGLVFTQCKAITPFLDEFLG
ncbi:MAG: DEAD/DEAH box helicase, partial [Lachnospiraceae bacterium]|nr:DEAD/DEAH box helicase [Lachnospiraceae bacterium]